MEIIQRLCQITAKEKNEHLALRIAVESGGCHGFQYKLELAELKSSTIPPDEADVYVMYGCNYIDFPNVNFLFV
jgi:Fe-S cluster assembly iron-binding protein IscA